MTTALRHQGIYSAAAKGAINAASIAAKNICNMQARAPFNGKTVFVSGVHSYVGSHVAQWLVWHGFRVKGSVRKVDP